MQFQVDKIRCYDKVLRSIVKNCDSATVSMHVDFSLGELTIQSREGIHAILKFQESRNTNSSEYKGFVEISTFLAVVKQFDDLEVDENLEFSQGDESFKLSTWDGGIPSIDFDSIALNGDEIVLSHEVAHLIESASKFVGLEGDSKDYSYLSVQHSDEKAETKIITTNGATMFLGDASEFIHTSFELSSDAIGIVIAALSQDIQVKIVKEEESFESLGRIILNLGDGDMQIAVGKSLAYSIPMIYEDSGLLERITIDSSFVVEKYMLEDVLKFYAPFTAKNVNQVLNLIVDNDSELLICCNSEVIGKRVISASDVDSSIIGNSFMFSRERMLKAIGNIHDDFLEISFNANSVPFTVTGKTNKDVLIVEVQISP